MKKRKLSKGTKESVAKRKKSKPISASIVCSTSGSDSERGKKKSFEYRMQDFFRYCHFADSRSKAYDGKDWESTESDSNRSGISLVTSHSSRSTVASASTTREPSPENRLSQSVLAKDNVQASDMSVFAKDNIDTQASATNQTMSVFLEADLAARKKSPNALTESESLFGNDELKEAESSKFVLNDIENAEKQTESSLSVLNDIENAATTLGSNISTDSASPEVCKLLASINGAIGSLKSKVEQNANKLDRILDIVVGEIEVTRQWRPQISNEVSDLKTVLDCEKLR